MHKVMGELGLSPASRSRVTAFPSLQPKPWEFGTGVEFSTEDADDDANDPARAGGRPPAPAIGDPR